MLLKNIVILILSHLCLGRHLEAEVANPGQHAATNLSIVNGHDMPPHALPSMVRVVLSDGKNNFYCGGTLIHRRFVLTAAHCFNIPGLTQPEVLLGVHRTDTSDVKQTRSAAAVTIHEQYVKDVNSHDIALMKLDRPADLVPGEVELGRLVSPIAYNTAEGSYDKKRGNLLGWGMLKDTPQTYAMVLQGLDVKMLTSLECPRHSKNEGTLCVGRLNDEPGVACYGDSGGPLMVDGLQVGVLSAIVEKTCVESYVTYAARVDYHRQWIVEKIKAML